MNPQSFSEAEIRRTAYALWEERLDQDGSSEEDWFGAIDLLERREQLVELRSPQFTGPAPEPWHVSKMVMACDESGSKSFANVDEQRSGEVGVFAGIVVSRDQLNAIGPDFDSVVTSYVTANGKLHITDLSAPDQHALRADMFDLIQKHSLPCFYEAIYVAGFHRAHKEHERMHLTGMASRRSEIKLTGASARPPAPERLHSTLFAGLYGQALAYCAEQQMLRVDLEVRTDRVDLTIIREFEGETAELLSEQARIEKVTLWDPSKREPVVAGVISQIAGEPILPLTVKALDLRTVDDKDGIVVAADVLANSLNHHLGLRSKAHHEMYGPLMSTAAVAGHPLQDHFVALPRTHFSASDTLYAHPSAQA